MNERDDEKVKHLIASNIAYYRKEMNLTQSELAEKINYSDKSISKWERGDGVPDICVLVVLADLFGVTVNDLLASKHKRSKFALPKLKHSIITLMSVGLVWLLASVVFFVLKLFVPGLPKAWLAFIFALPVMFIVTLVLSSIWHPRVFQFISVSGLIWTIAVALDLSFSLDYMNLVYIIAAVMQALTILWYMPKMIQFCLKHIKKHKSGTEQKVSEVSGGSKELKESKESKDPKESPKAARENTGDIQDTPRS